MIGKDNRGRFVKNHPFGRRFKKGHKSWLRGTIGLINGNSGSFKKGFTPWNKGKKGYKTSLRGRKNIGVTGFRNNFWKGGKTKTAEFIRFSRKYRVWRQKIFERDDYTCQKCRHRGGNMEVHHIKPQSLYPKLRFITKNGITLCKKCHRQTDSFGWKLAKNKKKFIKNEYHTSLQSRGTSIKGQSFSAKGRISSSCVKR